MLNALVLIQGRAAYAASMTRFALVTGIIYLLTMLSVGNAMASSEQPPLEQPTLKSFLVNQKIVGKGHYRYMWFSVYDVTLFAPQGRWQEDKEFSLKLVYHRKLSGEAIAERSVTEMRKQGFEDELTLAAWFEQMKKIFPDVRSDSSITGVFKPEIGVYFYHNGQPAGVIADVNFGRHFFDIWLSEKSSAPDLRKAILGQR